MSIITKKIIKDFSDELFCNNSFQYKDVNSNGFRSDEFTSIHNGKHIVFSGCSVTFGVGLEKEEIWAHRLYKKINSIEPCSGFFNLGVGGSGIDHICLNLFRYFKKYGNPNAIFINLPNQLRFFHYDNNLEHYVLKIDDIKEYDTIKFLNFQYYFMLEQYCYSNNIKLYSFSWDSFFKNINLESIEKKEKYIKDSIMPTNEIFKLYNFKTFYQINFDVMLKEVAELKLTNKEKYFHVARDGEHPGTGINNWWSNFIYNIYLGDK